MVASKPNNTPIPFNKDVLKWARERSGRTYEDAAKRAGVPAARIVEWESGASLPTVRQARALASDYDRPFLEFLAETIPEVNQLDVVPDFRLHRGASEVSDRARLIELQSWAETQRLNMIDLYDLLGEEIPRLPSDLQASVEEDPEKAATRARNAISFSISSQMNLSSREKDLLPKTLRSCMESAGIIVLRNSSLGDIKARGLCVYNDVLPIVVFGAEAPAAQAFTIAHELGHIMLRQSAIFGAPTNDIENINTKRLEKWCNAFAASFLIPKDELQAIFVRPDVVSSRIEDDTLSALARRFGVSRHAMMIRLVNLNYVTSSFYWNVKYSQLIEEEESFESGGRSPYYGTRFRTAVGDTYTGLVLEAWVTGRISNHNATEFMGIKNYRYLVDIRDHFKQ